MVWGSFRSPGSAQLGLRTPRYRWYQSGGLGSLLAGPEFPLIGNCCTELVEMRVFISRWSTLQIAGHVFLSTILPAKYYQPHFIDVKIKAQGSET